MGYDVCIERIGMQALIDLQGDAAAIAGWAGNELPVFPEIPNTYSERDHLQLCWIARQRWLLRAPLNIEAQLLDLIRPDAAPLDISAVQVSDTLCFFEISGPDAGDIISIASPLDHHAEAFPANGASYTNLFGIKGLLLRRETGFEIAVESSFADMAADYLARSNA